MKLSSVINILINFFRRLLALEERREVPMFINKTPKKKGFSLFRSSKTKNTGATDDYSDDYDFDIDCKC